MEENHGQVDVQIWLVEGRLSEERHSPEKLGG